MSKTASKTLEKKMKMQQRMEKLERELKELEAKAYEEIGKYLLKSWNVSNPDDSELIFEVIDDLKEEASDLLNKNEDKGKSETEETPQTY